MKKANLNEPHKYTTEWCRMGFDRQVIPTISYEQPRDRIDIRQILSTTLCMGFFHIDFSALFLPVILWKRQALRRCSFLKYVLQG